MKGVTRRVDKIPRAPTISPDSLAVGDIVRRHVVIYGTNNADREETLKTGRVIYIHPKRRFYTVDFGQHLRQCFRFFDGGDGYD